MTRMVDIIRPFSPLFAQICMNLYATCMNLYASLAPFVQVPSEKGLKSVRLLSGFLTRRYSLSLF